MSGYADDDSDSDEDRRLPRAPTDPDNEEKTHFLDVCYSFLEYQADANYDLQQMQAKLRALDPIEKKLWQVEELSWFKEIQQRVNVNASFCKMFPNSEVCGADLGPNADYVVMNVPKDHRVASRNSSKVRSTLRQFVRDWAKEGKAERDANYSPMIKALLQYLPPPKNGTKGAAPTVLCPGCGLARLPFDLVRLGYAAQGNEFSYHMLLGSHLILNRSEKAECFPIFPYTLSLTHRKGRWDHLRSVKVPDVCPMEALSGPGGGYLSMAAGEFVEVYKNQECAWDSVASCFFLDTAKNVFLYIRTIAHIIREGGFWVNLGPLLYHYADTNEISIELSWEEVRPYICKYFDIVEEEQRYARYTNNPEGLSTTRYRAIFFVAKRNAEQVESRVLSVESTR